MADEASDSAGHVPDPTQASSPPDRFKSFVQHGINLTLAFFGLPIVMAYLDVFKAPPLGELDAKALTVVAGVVCATAFLAMFFNRHLFTRPRVAVAGTVAVVVGVALQVLVARLAKGNPSLEGLWAPTYVVAFLILTCGVGAVFLNGFVRHHEYPRQLSAIAAALDSRQWDRLSALATGLLALQREVPRMRVPAQARQWISEAAEGVASSAAEQLQSLSAGRVVASDAEMRSLVPLLLGGSKEECVVVTDEAVDRWEPEHLSRLVELLDPLRHHVEVVTILSDHEYRQLEVSSRLKGLLVSGAKLRLIPQKDLKTDDVGKGFDYVLLGSRGLVRWNPMFGTLGTLSVAEKDLVEFAHRCKSVTSKAVKVPAKSGRSATVIESEDELTKVLHELAFHVAGS
jgi:hypothetical protein